MDHASFFIKNRALFGSFPTQESVEELEKEGVRHFVNLTHDYERKITPYRTNYNYISYPIKDHRIPEDTNKFAIFIMELCKIILSLKKNELLYVHCKGGHGRSGVVVSVILCHLFGLSPQQALEYTTKYHSKRIIMREKWRKLGSPQQYLQKNFVFQFCKPVIFHKATKVGPTAGFSNCSDHPVTIPKIGTFPTSEAAFQAFKDISNKHYVKKQQQAISPSVSKSLGNKIQVCAEWNEMMHKIMFNVLKYKFEQNEDIRMNLINTGLSPIIFSSKTELFWGSNENDGLNILGKQLVKIRSHYLLS
tara:strand:+ start:74 stop:988 length:915 start_codon:yes stop_codon:yes gene_type:complete